MGNLYDLIKKQYEEVVKYSELEKNDFLTSKSFNNVLENFKNQDYINSLIDVINVNHNKYFESEDKFKEILNNNKNLFKKFDSNGIPKIEKIDYVIVDLENYEEILNQIETNLNEEKINLIIFDLKLKINKKNDNVEHYLDSYITNIKKDVAKLFDEEEALNHNADLNYINSSLIHKKTPGPTEGIVEEVSIARGYVAKKEIKAFAESKGMDSNRLDNLDDKMYKSLELHVKNEDDIAFVKPIVDEIGVTEDFKNKILELNNLITELGVPSHFINGETDTKSYGLIDYFSKAKEVNNLIINYGNLKDDNAKREAINNISLKKKELEEVEKKYDRIFDYIKKNFDLDKISLNGNIYSGRLNDYNPNNLANFIPELPPKWDNENAPYGVILSGLCQLKGLAAKSEVSLEEYIDNPVQSYLKLAFKHADNVFSNAYRPRSEENTLGKRLAHAFIQGDGLTQLLAGVSYENRGLEFLNNVDNYNEKTIGNIIGTNLGINHYAMFDRIAEKMFFNGEEPSYVSLKNLFASGEKTDRLYELSENYFDVNMNKGSLINYENAVAQAGEKNPSTEVDRILNVLKDYSRERTEIYAHSEDYIGNDGGIMREIVPTDKVFVSAKEYFNDFVIKNNKNIFDCSKAERKEILSFMKDPVGAFVKRYEYELNISDDEIERLKNTYKAENDRLNRTKGESFERVFDSCNRKENGLNVGKNIQRIFNDNKGGWLERLGRTTSPQYKALKDSVLSALDPTSPNYGDLKTAKYFANKYIEHKLPEGRSFDDLKPNEKRRVEFSLSVIEACNRLENNNLNNEIQNNNIIVDEHFQNQLGNDVNLVKQNENIIDNNIKEEINKEIEP